MLSVLAVVGYRSLRDLVVPLEKEKPRLAGKNRAQSERRSRKKGRVPLPKGEGGRGAAG
jgi:hypothetical protein